MPRPNLTLTAARLATLVREGVPFPRDPGERVAMPGGERCIEQYGVTGELLGQRRYIRFHCADCLTDMYEVNSARGIIHAQKIGRFHKPGCCAQRAAAGVPSIWPDGVAG